MSGSKLNGVNVSTYIRSKLEDLAWKTRSARSMATRAAVCIARSLRDTSGARLVFNNSVCKSSKRSSSFGAYAKNSEIVLENHGVKIHFKLNLILET